MDTLTAAPTKATICQEPQDLLRPEAIQIADRVAAEWLEKKGFKSVTDIFSRTDCEDLLADLTRALRLREEFRVVAKSQAKADLATTSEGGELSTEMIAERGNMLLEIIGQINARQIFIQNRFRQNGEKFKNERAEQYRRLGLLGSAAEQETMLKEPGFLDSLMTIGPRVLIDDGSPAEFVQKKSEILAEMVVSLIIKTVKPCESQTLIAYFKNFLANTLKNEKTALFLKKMSKNPSRAHKEEIEAFLIAVLGEDGYRRLV